MGLKAVAAVVLAAVQLGGAFGQASATVVSRGDGSLLVELEVEVIGPAQAVVAHLAFEDDDIITLPLLDRGDGLFGIRTELAPKNYLVVFEALGVEGGLAPPVSLIDLGAELVPAAEGTPTEDGGLSPSTRRLGWLALALGAGSLAVLALWTLGERAGTEGSSEEEE